MKIICGKKDIYDPLVGIYGMDSHVVYDRRDCTTFIPQSGYNKGRNFFDSEKDMVVVQLGRIYCVFVVGADSKYSLANTFTSNSSLGYKTPVNIFAIKSYDSHPFYFRGSLINQAEFMHVLKEQLSIRNTVEVFPNVLLTSTPFLKMLPDAQTIYNNVYDYLLMLKNESQSKEMTDVQKIVSKGFDRVTSFRHPVR